MDVETELKNHGIILQKVTGISMEPLLHEHSTIVCIERLKQEVKKRDVVLFRRRLKDKSGEADHVLHRVIRLNPDGTFLLCGDNQIITETVGQDDILGVMTGFYDGEQYIDCQKDHRYGQYVKLWWLRYWLRFIRWGAGAVIRRIKRVFRWIK